MNAAWPWSMAQHGSNVPFCTGIPIAQVTRDGAKRWTGFLKPTFSWMQYQAHDARYSTSIIPRIDLSQKMTGRAHVVLMPLAAVFWHLSVR